jgi:hypothetical protein
MSKAVIFLQNAWSPIYAGKEWPRDSWLRALENCRSGKMLKNLTGDLTQVWNTTPEVGKTASSKLKPNLYHMESVLVDQRPVAIVACGQQAIDAARYYDEYPRLELPHPACRWLQVALYAEGKRLLDLMTIGQMNFRAKVWQKKGEPHHIEILRGGD